MIDIGGTNPARPVVHVFILLAKSGIRPFWVMISEFSSIISNKVSVESAKQGTVNVIRCGLQSKSALLLWIR